MDFEEYCKNYQPKPKNKNISDVKQENNKEKSSILNQDDLQEKIEKYKSFDNQQLMSELLKEVNSQKRNGNLTDEKLNEILKLLR